MEATKRNFILLFFIIYLNPYRASLRKQKVAFWVVYLAYIAISSKRLYRLIEVNNVASVGRSAAAAEPRPD